MKNFVYGVANKEDHAHKIVDQIRKLGIQNQDIFVILPSTLHGNAQGNLQGNFSKDIPSKGTTGQNPSTRGGSTNTNPMQATQKNPTTTPHTSSFPNATASLKNLNLPQTELKKYEESLKKNLIVIGVQSDANDRLDKVQDIFKKEGLKDVWTSREKTRSSH